MRTGLVTVQACDRKDAVVLVVACERIQRSKIDTRCTVCDVEWVLAKTVTGLETNLGLEGVLINRTNHLEWNVWAVEHTSIVW